MTTKEVKHEEALLVGGRGENAPSLTLQPHSPVGSLLEKPDPLVLCSSPLSLPLNLLWTSSSPCPTEEESGWTLTCFHQHCGVGTAEMCQMLGSCSSITFA